MYAQNDSQTAALVSQPHLHLFDKFQEYVEDTLIFCFIVSFTVAEKHALQSLYLHFVARYKIFVIIIIIMQLISEV